MKRRNFKIFAFFLASRICMKKHSFLSVFWSIKNAKNTRKQHFFLQIQGFCKFFTNHNELAISCIKPYLYICRKYIYNNNNTYYSLYIYTF